MFRVTTNGRGTFSVWWTWWVNPVDAGIGAWGWKLFPGGRPIPEMKGETSRNSPWRPVS